MNCGCKTYECLDVYLAGCAAVVVLPIVADQTGTWIMITEFNGQHLRTDVNVTSGSPITIPVSALNENYRHTIRFYKTDGTIFNDTCYTLNAMATIFTNPAPAATTVTTSLPITADSDGNIIQSDDLIGVIVHDVITVNDAVYSMAKNGLSYDPATGEIDLTNIGGYFTDNTITILYEKTA
jgi:hypothetical protein